MQTEIQQPQIKGKINSKKLIAWINAEFERFEITEYRVTEIIRTRYRSQDYEAGAAFLNVKFEHKLRPNICGHFLCFYPLYEYQKHLDSGYRLVLKSDHGKRFGSINDLTVDLIR